MIQMKKYWEIKYSIYDKVFEYTMVDSNWDDIPINDTSYKFIENALKKLYFLYKIKLLRLFETKSSTINRVGFGR